MTKKKKKLSEQRKFRLSEIIPILFIKILIKGDHAVKRNKYVSIFDYIDKALIVLSETSGGVLTILFKSITDVPLGIVNSSFSPIFSLATGIVKTMVNTTRDKKKNHEKILMLAKSKLNSIETLISQAVMDIQIIHREFITIFKEKDIDEKMKDNLRSGNEKYKVINLSSIKSKI